MNPTEAFCPNPDCPLHGIRDQDNIHVHSHKEKRYRCRRCNKTFAETKGTPFYRRQYKARFISEVISLLAYGCPPQAIVATYRLDERTVYAWQRAAGQHSKVLHEHLLRPMDLQQVQADELRVKAQGQVLWMAMAICVTTRLWLGGVVSTTRDKALVNGPTCESVCFVSSPVGGFRRLFGLCEGISAGLSQPGAHRASGSSASGRMAEGGAGTGCKTPCKAKALGH